jgi:hypothetical protein
VRSTPTPSARSPTWLIPYAGKESGKKRVVCIIRRS